MIACHMLCGFGIVLVREAHSTDEFPKYVGVSRDSSLSLINQSVGPNRATLWRGEQIRAGRALLSKLVRKYRVLNTTLHHRVLMVLSGQISV